jgi:hypothetical protein
MADLNISQAGIDLIVNEETGGQAYFYHSGENHPDWPGGQSGVTIGIGYDLGYSTPSTIAADWAALPEDEIVALQSVAGIHGAAASSHAHELHWVTVSWEVAMDVFANRDLPKWVDICDRDLPNFGDLHGDCRGALVSLAFNRGESWNTSAANDATGRYREMRAIKSLMMQKRFDDIPAQFLAMRRLWPVDGDLWKRRGHEADLFKQGLIAMKAGELVRN